MAQLNDDSVRVIGMDEIYYIGLGSCLLSHPTDPLTRTGLIRSAVGKVGIRVPTVYCIDEAVQVVDFLRGEKEIPLEIRELCDIKPEWTWDTSWLNSLAEAQIVLLEPYSPISIALGPYPLVRGSLITHITDPLLARQEGLRRPLHVWWNQGLLGADENARTEAGSLLANAVDDAFPKRDVAREVFLGARSFRRTEAELIEGIAKVSKALDRPTGIMLPIHRCLPDGRAMSWPPEFREEVTSAAHKLNLPLFDPAPHVKAFGVARAWRDEGGPYHEAFWPVLGDALYAFMNDVLARSPRA